MSETSPQDAVHRPVLQRNATGPDVDTLKQMLATIGLDPGPLDETFGTRTYRAVVSFQRQEGLESDGVVGARTWEALEHAVADRAAQSEAGDTTRGRTERRRRPLSVASRCRTPSTLWHACSV